ncbi:MAG TPA: hypothetical protein VGP72_27735 [Planctomycetota bacterium]|jgi:hypothetical protein
MKRFNIVKLEERIAPTIVPGMGIFHEDCPPGLDKKMDLDHTPVDVVSTGCGCMGCTMWNDNANENSRVFDTSGV